MVGDLWIRLVDNGSEVVECGFGEGAGQFAFRVGDACAGNRLDLAGGRQPYLSRAVRQIDVHTHQAVLPPGVLADATSP